MMMRGDPAIHSSLQSDYEAWRDLLRSRSGRYYSEGIKPDAFTGWVRPVSAHGFTAMDIGCNACRVERTVRDIRLDGADHYFAVFLVSGRLAMIHNDQTVQLAAGDVAFVDAARPVTYFADDAAALWNTVSLNLPRRSLISHLGFEPKGGLYRPGRTPAARLLLDLIRHIDNREGSALSPAESYMQLAVYDLIGALFAPTEPWMASGYWDKLFARIREVVKDGFADPDFGPPEVAVKAGISLRYLQKLFTRRGSTCSELIYSFRLEHAAQLLHRRDVLGAGQSLSEVAYACGFGDYTHFARRFRRRFGHAPGEHSAKSGDTGNQAVRFGTGEGAFSSHDIEASVP